MTTTNSILAAIKKLDGEPKFIGMVYDVKVYSRSGVIDDTDADSSDFRLLVREIRKFQNALNAERKRLVSVTIGAAR